MKETVIALGLWIVNPQASFPTAAKQPRCGGSVWAVCYRYALLLIMGTKLAYFPAILNTRDLANIHRLGLRPTAGRNLTEEVVWIDCVLGSPDPVES